MREVPVWTGWLVVIALVPIEGIILGPRKCKVNVR